MKKEFTEKELFYFEMFRGICGIIFIWIIYLKRGFL